MKKYNSLKNIGRFSIAIALMATALLSSCLKDTSPGALNLGASPALLGFQYTGFNAVPYVAAIFGTAKDSIDVKVTLSVPSITLGNAVTATLVADPTYVPSSFQVLPTSVWTLPNGGKVTIPAGQQYATVVIRIAGNTIDFTKSWAFGIKITDSSGPVIASNLSEALVIISLKSVDAGNYKVNSGATTRYFGGTVGSGFRDSFPVAEASINYSTVGINSVNGQVGSSSFGLSGLLTFNGTVVTVTADPAGSLGGNTFNYAQGDSKGAASSYDPATKTLIIHCSYLNGAGALREIDMNMTGPQ